MPDRECPECLARRERFSGAAEDLAKFKVGQVVRGRCNRCLYRAPIPLDDTAEFELMDQQSVA